MTAAAPPSGMELTPNLWWPADRAWTYVSGPAGLIERILDDERIEALPSKPGDPLTHIEAWVATWVDQATAQLLSGGETVITTPRGSVHAWLDRPSRLRHGILHTGTMGDNGVSGGSGVHFSHRGEEELREEISMYLTSALIGLVGG